MTPGVSLMDEVLAPGNLRVLLQPIFAVRSDREEPYAFECLSGVDPRRLVLEIAEHSPVWDRPSLSAGLVKLLRRGSERDPGGGFPAPGSPFRNLESHDTVPRKSRDGRAAPPQTGEGRAWQQSC